VALWKGKSKVAQQGGKSKRKQSDAKKNQRASSRRRAAEKHVLRGRINEARHNAAVHVSGMSQSAIEEMQKYHETHPGSYAATAKALNVSEFVVRRVVKFGGQDPWTVQCQRRAARRAHLQR
jgi:hypothetical protein